MSFQVTSLSNGPTTKFAGMLLLFYMDKFVSFQVTSLNTGHASRFPPMVTAAVTQWSLWSRVAVTQWSLWSRQGGGHYGTDLTILQKSTDDKLKRTIFTTLQRTTDFNKKSSHMNYTWPEIFLARFLFIESLWTDSEKWGNTESKPCNECGGQISTPTPGRYRVKVDMYLHKNRL